MPDDPSRAAARVAPLNQARILSHGTITCRDIAQSRRFYEEFLGLDCVKIQKRALMLRKGGYCAIICLEVGDHVKPVDRQHHWGIDLDSTAAVDRALALAHELQEKYRISQISRIATHHGTYSFYFRDLDGNYWEFQYAGEGQMSGGGMYDQQFARGDFDDE
ncbi:MAG TPA: VOC family protein [Stellaceae bacterium]|nr:VOC family protein [Stellaceae bacterium]